MNEKKSLIELQFASLQNEHEKKVIEAFLESPSENVASICLEVGGIEHILLIRETDYPKLCTLLVELNRAQSERLEEMQNRQNQNSIWY